MSNTQGAPTVGLGQHVTFAGDPITGAPMQDRLGVAGVQTRGGPAPLQLSQPGQVDPTRFNDIAAATSLFGDQVTKKLEQLDQKHFVSGMMDAAQGATVEKVAAQQPWYANIFGTSAGELGAKAFTAMESANKVMVDLQSRLPSLAQLDYAAAKEEMTKVMDSAITGDPEADAITRNTFLKTLPTLVEGHTRARIQYVQEQTLLRQSGARRSSFAAMQALYTQKQTLGMDDAEYLAQLEGHVGDTTPVVGQNPAMFNVSLTADLIEAAKAGQLQAVNAYLANGRAELLPPEYRTRIQGAMKEGNRLLAQEWHDKNLETLAVMERDLREGVPGKTPKQLFDALMDFAKRGQVEQGMTESPYSETRAKALLIGGMNAVSAEEARQARELETRAKSTQNAADKLKAQQELDAMRGDALARRDAHLARSRGVKDIELETHIYNEYASTVATQGLGAAFANLGKWNGGSANLGFKADRVAAHVQNRIEAVVKSAEKVGVSDQLLADVYQPWLAAKEAGVSSMYFGSKWDAALEKFHSMYRAGGTPEEQRLSAVQAFDYAFVKSSKGKVTAKDAEGIRDSVKKATGGGFFSDGLIDGWTDDQLVQAAGTLGAADYPSVSEGARALIPTAIRSGRLERWGGSVIDNGDAPSMTKLLETRSKHSDSWGAGTISRESHAELFDEIVQVKLHGLPGQVAGSRIGGVVPEGVSIEGKTVVRFTEKDEPMLIVIANGSDGKPYPMSVKAEDFHAMNAKKLAQRYTGFYAKRDETWVRNRALVDRATQFIINRK
jgi:hypothetical protein